METPRDLAATHLMDESTKETLAFPFISMEECKVEKVDPIPFITLCIRRRVYTRRDEEGIFRTYHNPQKNK